MDITLKKITANYGTISVVLDEADYKLAVEKQIQRHAQTTRLKGFRQGAAPCALVKKLYGTAILDKEIKHIAELALKKYLHETHTHVIVEPLLVDAPKQEDLKHQTTFTFCYEIGFMENYDLNIGSHISVTEYTIDKIEDKFIDDFLEGLQIVHGETTELQESTKNSILYGYIKPYDNQTSLKLRIIVDKIPKALQKSCIGLHQNDTILLTPKMLENHSAALLCINFGVFDYLKKQGQFNHTFTIDKIISVNPAPINVELFDLVLGKGIVDSESAFREQISKIILYDKQTEAKYTFQHDLRKALLDGNVIELPDEFLKKWLTVNNPKSTEKAIEDYYNENKVHLKWEILLGYIFHKYNLHISQNEIIQEAKQVSLNYLKHNLKDKDKDCDEYITNVAIAFLKNNNGENYIKMHNNLSRQKAIDFIKSNISLIQKTVSAQEFDNRN